MENIIKGENVKIISICSNSWTGKVYGLGDDGVLYFWGSVKYSNVFFGREVKRWVVEL